MFSLRQLRYLVALAETRHFGRAAALSNVSQPALSMQIKELEASLGLDLIERRRGAVELTVEGRHVLALAQQITTSARDLEDFTRSRRGRLIGPLVLGMIPSIAPYLLPLCLARITARFPQLVPQIRETQTETLISELRFGAVDAAIMARPSVSHDLSMISLFDDPFLLAVSADRACDYGEPITPATIDSQPLLLLEQGHCLRDQALNYCGRVAPGQMVTLGATSLTTVLQMVGAGFGVTLLPDLVLRAGLNDPRLAFRRFADPAPQREVVLIWRSSAPRAADYRALASVIRDGWASAAAKAAQPTPGRRAVS